MVKNGRLERIGILYFGHYLQQSPMTILTTKQYDIKHNHLQFDSKTNAIAITPREHGLPGICFWAYTASKTAYRTFLSGEKCDFGPRYIIMPYTPSPIYKDFGDGSEHTSESQEHFNAIEGESIETFYNRMQEEFDKRLKKTKKGESVCERNSINLHLDMVWTVMISIKNREKVCLSADDVPGDCI